MKFHEFRSIGILAFWNGLEYHNCDFSRLIGNHFCTSRENLVRLGLELVIPEFYTKEVVRPESIILTTVSDRDHKPEVLSVLHITFLPRDSYAKRGIRRRRVSVCVCHTPVLYQNG